MVVQELAYSGDLDFTGKFQELKAVLKTKNIVMVGECHSVQLKIEMDRPFVTEENYMHSTPIVYDYKLRLTTGGETIEY